MAAVIALPGTSDKRVFGDGQPDSERDPLAGQEPAQIGAQEGYVPLSRLI